METLDRILLLSHIFVGTISLIIFWIPVFVKKGGKTHVLVGKAYCYCMWYVLVTAVILSIINIIQGIYVFGAFLGYLAILTAHPLWYAIAITKYKKDIPVSLLMIRKIINVILFVGALILITWSILLKFQHDSSLLMVFGLLGLFGSIPHIRTDKKYKSDWLSEHLGGMMATGIAAYTAFFAFGGSTLFGGIFTGPLMVIPWMLPTFIGTFLIIRMKRKLGLKK